MMTPISEATASRALALAAAHLKQKAIARELGISQPSVSRILRGIHCWRIAGTAATRIYRKPGGPPPRRFSDETIAQLRQRRKTTNDKVYALAVDFGMSESYVSRILSGRARAA